MRDAVGGTFMIYVFLIFLAVYITFVAVAFNYARAFKVKNKVIDIIEQNEGIDQSEFNNTSGTKTDGTIGKINEYLKQVNYNIKTLSNSEKENRGTCFDLGYCIEKIDAGKIDGIDATYYKVTTFVRLEIPFLELGFTIPIKGETRKIERINR